MSDGFWICSSRIWVSKSNFFQRLSLHNDLCHSGHVASARIRPQCQRNLEVVTYGDQSVTISRVSGVYVTCHVTSLRTSNFPSKTLALVSHYFRVIFLFTHSFWLFLFTLAMSNDAQPNDDKSNDAEHPATALSSQISSVVDFWFQGDPNHLHSKLWFHATPSQDAQMHDQFLAVRTLPAPLSHAHLTLTS